MEAEALPPAQVDLQKGFTWHHGAYDKKTQGLQAERQFLAPNCIRYAGRPGSVGSGMAFHGCVAYLIGYPYCVAGFACMQHARTACFEQQHAEASSAG